VPTLSKAALLDRILSAIRAAGWNVVFLTPRHPWELAIFRNEQTFRIRLYVWNVTHGGGQARAPTEYRIQITGVTIPLEAPSGFQTLILGWYEPLSVVAAFDPARHRRPSMASPSIQISIDALQEAAQRGLAVQRRGNREIVIAFRPELLITYIENQQSLHAFAGSQADIDLLIQAGAGQQPTEQDMQDVPIERQKVIRMVATRRREASFRQRVLSAYQYRCAMCHLQLDLVEGAHIFPVGVPGSTDQTSNGLALCPLHHEAYDDALVGVREDYEVVVNGPVLQHLRSLGRDGEEQRFRQELRPRIVLPATAADRPRPEYLRRGLHLRGWAVA
jgi:putative restriction endonuclease